jgi:protein-disulfide isomerase
MIKTKQLLLVFVPAILLVSFALFVRFLQQEVIFPGETPDDDPNVEDQIQIPIFPDDPIIGDKKAPITLVLFTDLACGGCQDQDLLLDEIIQNNPGKLKVIWKSLPVTSFPAPSRWAHEYAFCANEQGRLDAFKTMAFANKENLLPETLEMISTDVGLDAEELTSCLNSARPDTYITNTEDLARLLNIQSVPTFFLNNEQIKTPRSAGGWNAILGL